MPRQPRRAQHTTTAPALAAARAGAVSLFASVERSPLHHPDDDAVKHAIPGPSSLVKIDQLSK
jgi:hypothetical protein